MRTYYVYILASGKNGTLYIGMTNNLQRRLFEHKEGEVAGFTKQYSVYQLVYFEETSDVRTALQREKRFKKWNRQWKLDLINESNPDWSDLATSL